MPSLKKILSGFNEKERESIEFLIEKIISLNWRSLDIKKLKGHQNIFRARLGKIRIIFTNDKKEISIIAIERRRESTYNF